MRLYLPAAVVGSIAWAALYATIGLAFVQVWIAAMTGSWYGIAGMVAIVVVATTTWLLGRRRTQRRNGVR
jgi:membrane protein DedA with SNARE-associated domain